MSEIEQEVLSSTEEKNTIVPKEKWSSLTLEELFEQKTILLDRWEYLILNNYSYASELLKASHELEEYIQTKLSPESIPNS